MFDSDQIPFSAITPEQLFFKFCFAAIDFAEKARRALKIILLVISSQLKHDKAYESLDWCLDRHFGRLHNERS